MTVGLVGGEELLLHSAEVDHVLLPNDHLMDEEEELFSLVEGELLAVEDHYQVGEEL